MATTAAQQRREAAPLEDAPRERLRRLIDRDGLKQVAKRFRLAPNTLARALAGLGIYEGTAVLIEQRLKEER